MREIGNSLAKKARGLLPQTPQPPRLTREEWFGVKKEADDTRSRLADKVVRRMWARRAVYTGLGTLAMLPVTSLAITGSLGGGAEVLSQITSNPNLPIFGLAGATLGIACLNGGAALGTLWGAEEWARSAFLISRSGKKLKNLECQLGLGTSQYPNSDLAQKYSEVQNANKLSYLRYGLIALGALAGGFSGGPLAVVTGAAGAFGGNIVFHGLERIIHYGTDHRLIVAARGVRKAEKQKA